MTRKIQWVAGVVLVVGCADEQDARCRSDSECADGKACNLITGHCAQGGGSIEELGFEGAFDCELGGDLGAPDVVGRVDGELIRLNAIACDDDLESGVWSINMLGSAGQTGSQSGNTLMLVLDFAPPDSVALTLEAVGYLDDRASEQVGVTLVAWSDGWEGARVVATGKGGRLDVKVEHESERLSGSLALTMRPIGGSLTLATSGALGAACEVHYDCNINEELACLESFGCSRACSTDSDCSDQEGRCQQFQDLEKGVCAKECASTASCVHPDHKCLQLDERGGLCLPVELVGAEDPT